jgi:hypothetical protein
LQYTGEVPLCPSLTEAFAASSKPAHTDENGDQANHGSNQVQPFGQSLHTIELSINDQSTYDALTAVFDCPSTLRTTSSWVFSNLTKSPPGHDPA